MSDSTVQLDNPRLQTLLAYLGIASRRRSAEIIRSGNVAVNGQTILEPGFRVADPYSAAITVGGRVYTLPAKGIATRTIMLNKPVGLICSSDSRHGKTVFSCLRSIRERLVTVGRLDKDSGGLLLLSNNGELVNRLTHPRYGHEKEYVVETRGVFKKSISRLLNSPMVIDNYEINPAIVEHIKRLPKDYSGEQRNLLRFILNEGRNRQIRKMCNIAGLEVVNLTRIAVNGLRLPDDLLPGMWRDLTQEELKLLSEPLRR